MDRLYVTDVLTPKQTLASSPLLTTWKLEDAWLEYIEIIVPQGHNGFTGISIVASQQLVIPWKGAQWLIANDDKITISWRDYVNAAELTIQTYNTDMYDHTFYIRAQISDTPFGTQQSATSTPTSTPTDLTGLSGVNPLGAGTTPTLPTEIPPITLPPIPTIPGQPQGAAPAVNHRTQRYVASNT